MSPLHSAPSLRVPLPCLVTGISVLSTWLALSFHACPRVPLSPLLNADPKIELRFQLISDVTSEPLALFALAILLIMHPMVATPICYLLSS